MSKGKGKQSTLFGSWGYNSKQKTNPVTEPSPDAEVISNAELQFDQRLLDAFFAEDDETTHRPQCSKGTTTAHNYSSVYEDIPGFDYEAGETFIYPTNYPTRDYQFNIIKKCLYRNTLVSLPTGLGKTFIAAVVMYNFYRWYPSKRIVFLAPTKPLVSQQMEACFKVMGKPLCCLYISKHVM